MNDIFVYFCTLLYIIIFQQLRPSSDLEHILAMLNVMIWALHECNTEENFNEPNCFRSCLRNFDEPCNQKLIALANSMVQQSLEFFVKAAAKWQLNGVSSTKLLKPKWS